MGGGEGEGRETNRMERNGGSTVDVQMVPYDVHNNVPFCVATALLAGKKEEEILLFKKGYIGAGRA